MSRLRKVLEITGLPAPIAWLDAYAGTIVSVLQAHGALGRVCTHDPITLRPAIVERPEGLVRSARLSRTQRERLAICSWADGTSESAVVEVWDLRTRSRTARSAIAHAHDAVPWRDGVVVDARGRPSTLDHRVEARVYDASLESCLAELRVNEEGMRWVAGDVIATSGIDLHLWRPDRREPAFGLFESSVSSRIELGSCALSDDGAWAALACDRTDSTEPLARWSRVADPVGPIVRVLDEARGRGSRIAFAPDAATLALSFAESPTVRAHRTHDGELIAEVAVPGQRSIAWLDAHHLLIGGDALSLWSLET